MTTTRFITKTIAALFAGAMIAGVGVVAAAPASAATIDSLTAEDKRAIKANGGMWASDLIAKEDGGTENQDFILNLYGYKGKANVTVSYQRYAEDGSVYTAFNDTFKASNGKYRLTIPVAHGDESGTTACTNVIVKVTDAKGKHAWFSTGGTHYTVGTEELLDEILVQKM